VNRDPKAGAVHDTVIWRYEIKDRDNKITTKKGERKEK
jgi:hypothetical protein